MATRIPLTAFARSIGARSTAGATASHTPTRPAPRARVALLTLWAATALAASASAQSTLLQGSVSTTDVGTIQQNWANVPLSSLQGLHAHDAHGNDGVANGTLSIPNGRILLSPHAYSGGGVGLSGQAQGSSSTAVILDYVLTSGSLPAGTPVNLQVNWAVASRVTAVGYDMVGANTVASSSSAVHLSLAPNYNVTVNRLGSLSRTINTSGNQTITSGTINVTADAAPYVFPMQVGLECPRSSGHWS